jgi:hypothetical protein
MGATNGLTLFLDTHALTGTYKSGKTGRGNFQLIFEHFDSFPLVSFKGIEVSHACQKCLIISNNV